MSMCDKLSYFEITLIQYFVKFQIQVHSKNVMVTNIPATFEVVSLYNYTACKDGPPK